MKSISIICLCLFSSFAFTAERENLLTDFHKENIAVQKEWDNAMTQNALTGAAGNNWRVAQHQLFRALDYKLRNTSELQKRLDILNKFHVLSRKVQKIYDTPRKDRGSIIGMQIYSHIAYLMQQQIDILLLDNKTELQWNRLANAELVIDGKEVELKDGIAEYCTVMYKENVTLEIILFPKDTFLCRNRNFAVIKTDIRFAGNDDYSSVYLYELKNNKLTLKAKCEFPSITKWELSEDIFTFFSGDKKQKIKL
ncbi:MAG: hypothetical protein IJY46_05065 [Lentisphaeria bacterium]|nr:hypothetical protein [Lentisphaeria bacterium]